VDRREEEGRKEKRGRGKDARTVERMVEEITKDTKYRR
jgi:hypothetical protein